MEELIRLLTDYYPMPPELLVTILQKFTKEVHRKNKRLLEPGDSCQWVAFIEKGLVKVFHEADNGAELIEGFYREADIIGFNRSFLQQLPSLHTIQVLDELHVRKIQKVELDAICLKYPIFNIHLLKILSSNLQKLEDHNHLLLEPAKNRLSYIKQFSPWLLDDKRIKDYMLAAYLGIDKSTLSRYRNDTQF